jgi:hypothetical protein
MQCVTLSPRSRLSHPLPLCAGKTADVLTRTHPPNNPAAPPRSPVPYCRCACTARHFVARRNQVPGRWTRTKRTNECPDANMEPIQGQSVCVLRGSVCPAASTSSSWTGARAVQAIGWMVQPAHHPAIISGPTIRPEASIRRATNTAASSRLVVAAPTNLPSYRISIDHSQCLAETRTELV